MSLPVQEGKRKQASSLIRSQCYQVFNQKNIKSALRIFKNYEEGSINSGMAFRLYTNP